MTGPGRRTIRVFPDWASEWPLWETGHPGYNMEPADYDLSAELSARLRSWADDFYAALDINADPPVWGGAKTWRTWVEDGRRICEALSYEVASFADVVYDIDPNER